MSVAVLINWVANFLVGYCFPYMQVCSHVNKTTIFTLRNWTPYLLTICGLKFDIFISQPFDASKKMLDEYKSVQTLIRYCMHVSTDQAYSDKVSAL